MPTPAPTSEAIAKLAELVAASDEPALAEPTLTGLLVDARRIDPAGRAPDAAGWIPTYSFDAAAAAGWTRKAGRAAGQVNFAAGAIRADRGQIHAHCLRMAEHFQRRLQGGRRGGGALSVEVISPTRAALDAEAARGSG